MKDNIFLLVTEEWQILCYAWNNIRPFKIKNLKTIINLKPITIRIKNIIITYLFQKQFLLKANITLVAKLRIISSNQTSCVK